MAKQCTDIDECYSKFTTDQQNELCHTFDGGLGTLDVGTYCPDGCSCKVSETYGLTSEETYGYCPNDYGVCCNNCKHWCPQNYNCSGGGELCIKGTDNSVPMYTPPMTEAHVSPSELHEINNFNSSALDVSTHCPGGSSYTGHETCCLISPKAYGCCPNDYGVCSNDYKNCCAQSYESSGDDKLCVKGTDNSVPMYTPPLTEAHVSTSQLHETNNFNSSTLDVGTHCPDASSCTSHETCYLISPKPYDCCPNDYGIYYNDYKHYCPQGYEFSDCGELRIKGNDNSIPMYTPPLTEAHVSTSQLHEIGNFNSSTLDNNTHCPDECRCTGHETCCLTSPKTYGYCPIDYGVCHNDYKHCCRQGYEWSGEGELGIKTTDPATMHTPSLTQASISPREIVEIDDFHTSTVPVDVHCADGSNCRDKQTCCQTSPESYGCCPAEHTVVRDDCSYCLQGYECAGNFCIKNDNYGDVFRNSN